MDLSFLNQNQLASVVSNAQFIRVVAGAGSGKTRVLTTRIIHLIKEKGVRPYSIYAITFTNKAANEMKERVHNVLGYTLQTITTFHSLAVRILREDIDLLGMKKSFIIIDEDDQKRLIKKVINDCDLTLSPKEISSFIGLIKSGATFQPGTYSREYEREGHTAYKSYQAYLRKYNYLDFDDLLIFAVKLLQEHPVVRAKWQERISHLLIDEFQDTNDVQYDLMLLLLAPTANLFIVGDADQTIYTWRGANADLFLDFEKRFPKAETFILDLNYRSTTAILECANCVIANNPDRIKKDLKSELGLGVPVIFYRFATAAEEAEYVARTIYSAPGDTTILIRSAYLSRPLEMALTRQRIKYKIYGGVRFFEREEIKDMIAYLRVINDEADDIALERIINKPRRGIGETTQEKMIDWAQQQGVSLAHAYRNNGQGISTSAVKKIDHFFELITTFREFASGGQYDLLIDLMVEQTGYLDYLNFLQDEGKKENLEEFKKYLKDFKANNPEGTIANILENLALFSLQDEIDNNAQVKIMTIHAAKGLEFDRVFIVAMCEGVLPNYRSLMEGKIDEERRLAYVAFTRAKKQLYLTTNSDFNFQTSRPNVVSRFVREAQLLNNEKPLLTPAPAAPTTPIEGQWQVGDLLIHQVFGEGKVVEIISNTIIRVAFADATRTMAAFHHMIRRKNG